MRFNNAKNGIINGFIIFVGLRLMGGISRAVSRSACNIKSTKGRVLSLTNTSSDIGAYQVPQGSDNAIMARIPVGWYTAKSA